MNVIKLGGSLAHSDQLSNCLRQIELDYWGTAVVVVPGGGAFADQVRLAQQHWHFNDRTAHCMALLAMQQMALMINGLKPTWCIANSLTTVRVLLSQNKTVIWSPDVQELDQAGITATWDITSDSLAAWLAGQLCAEELLLIKAAPIPSGLTVTQLAAQGLLDKAFCCFIEHADYTVRIVSGSER